jgi:hypothetical protein
MVFDEAGERLTPTHAVKKRMRYLSVLCFDLAHHRGEKKSFQRPADPGRQFGRPGIRVKIGHPERQ